MHERVHRLPFGSLAALASTVKAARPDRHWRVDQLSAGASPGQLAWCDVGRVRLTATRVTGSFEMNGSADTLAFATTLPPGGRVRQWYRPVPTGAVLLFTPRTDHQGSYTDRANYIAIDITPETLEAEVAQSGYPVDAADIARGRLLARPLTPAALRWMGGLAASLHRGHLPALAPGHSLDAMLLSMLVPLLSERGWAGHRLSGAQAGTIVRRARAFVGASLHSPIPVDAMAAAAGCTRAALYLAFRECLDETPRAYVLKLRLNRIREDLASPGEASATVTTVSHHWGIGELGRLADQYRAQFGELPSETLARRHRLLPAA